MALERGEDVSTTDVYQELSSIANGYGADARSTMKLGLTEPSKSFSARWQEALERKAKFAREASARQDRLRFDQN